MKGNDIYRRVLSLLGYLNSDIVIAGEQNLLKRVEDIINQICIDLKIPQIKLLSDEIKATPEAVEALCYGAAMLMALQDGDGVKNELFAQIYNSKRAAVLSKKETVEDKLPFVSYGVD